MASTESNQAAWMDGVKQPLRVGPADKRTPGKDQLVVRVRAVALNPVDYKMQDIGLFVQQWPCILGLDAAGEVHEVGSAVTRFKKGDRIVAHSNAQSVPDGSGAAFQHFAVFDADKATTIPDNISFADASVLPVAFDTAEVGLSGEAGKFGLGLPPPSLEPESANKTLLLWGGSSSVGALVTQVAVASGVKVVAVASRRNADFCRGCGASEVLDYNDDSIVEEAVKAIREAGGEFAGVYNAISTPETLPPIYAIAEKLGGCAMAYTLPNLQNIPDHVKGVPIFGSNAAVSGPYWKTFLPAALKEGKLKCLPEPWVVGKGLESLQEGLDTLRKGVSAKKVVIEL